ncbi:Zn-ribbon domain-containing OB-fold protein [Mycolicibacterium pulveris]|uniref:Zn-ribbon domain-containing OB-fold protein n=1 Tax=Mycolicibacterium pulveris TaxID=36813 RepID=UPI003CE72796
MTDAPSPVIDDPDTGGFWQAAQRGVLALQWCDRCDQPIHLPRPQCPSCASTELTWREVDGEATLHSWTLVRHPVHPAFPVPYTIALVALTDYPMVHLMTRIDGAAPLREGQRMRFSPCPDSAGVMLPQWQARADDSEGE